MTNDNAHQVGMHTMWIL